MGCCPSKSKSRGATACARGNERADLSATNASAARDGVRPNVPASGDVAGGANATSGASLPAAERRASAASKGLATSPAREVLLGEQKEQTEQAEQEEHGQEEQQGEEEEEEESDAFDEDPRAHLVPTKTTGRRGSGDRAQFQLEVAKISPSGGETSVAAVSPALLALRSPARTPVNYDDMPIASTYHRVLSATLADKEAKRKEEARLEAELREREVQEYKAAMSPQA